MNNDEGCLTAAKIDIDIDIEDGGGGGGGGVWVIIPHICRLLQICPHRGAELVCIDAKLSRNSFVCEVLGRIYGSTNLHFFGAFARKVCLKLLSDLLQASLPRSQFKGCFSE